MRFCQKRANYWSKYRDVLFTWTWCQLRKPACNNVQIKVSKNRMLNIIICVFACLITLLIKKKTEFSITSNLSCKNTLTQYVKFTSRYPYKNSKNFKILNVFCKNNNFLGLVFYMDAAIELVLRRPIRYGSYKKLRRPRKCISAVFSTKFVSKKVVEVN